MSAVRIVGNRGFNCRKFLNEVNCVILDFVVACFTFDFVLVFIAARFDFIQSFSLPKYY